VDLGITRYGNVKGGIYFNVSRHVGMGQANQTEDVYLVQYLCRRMAVAGVPAPHRSVYFRSPLSAPPSGRSASGMRTAADRTVYLRSPRSRNFRS
jgi:hypothetical protein